VEVWYPLCGEISLPLVMPLVHPQATCGIDLTDYDLPLHIISIFIVLVISLIGTIIPKLLTALLHEQVLQIH
jgi:hypothetical protein